MNMIKQLLQFSSCFSVDCSGRSGGLALLWNQDVVFSLNSYSPNHIDGWISWDNLR